MPGRRPATGRPPSPRRRPPTRRKTAPARSTPPPPPIPTAIRSPSRSSGGADRAAFTITAGRRLVLRRAARFRGAGRRRPQQCLSGPDRGQRRHDQRRRSISPSPSPMPGRTASTSPGSAPASPQPLYLTAVPDGSGRVFVVEQAGRIRILNPATGAIAATPFLDVIGPDLDRRRARPARLRAGAQFRRHRHLLRLPDQPGGHDRDPPLLAPSPAIATRPIRRRPT